MAIRIFEMSALRADRPLFVVPYNVVQTPGTVGASSVQSSAFATDTNVVLVQTDEACHVAFGTDPTATTSHHKLAAGGEASFCVTPGDKVAWIQA